MRREIEIKRGLSPIILIDPPDGWNRRNWQPDMLNGFSAETFVKSDLFHVIRLIFFALTLTVSLTACGAGSQKWKEEVQLSDGKIIVVERETIREGGGDEWAANRSLSKPKTYCIQFEYPIASGQTVKWCSKKSDSQTWPEVPLAMDIDSGEPVIFTTLAISATCKTYLKYIYRNGKWTEEKLLEQFEQRTTNLLFASKKDLPSVLSLQDKFKRNDDIGYHKAFKQIGPTLKVCNG